MIRLVATTVTIPDVVQFLNYGVLGIVVVLLALRKLVPGQFWQEERDARVSSDNYVRETLIPLVSEMTRNQERSTELLMSFKHERDEELSDLRADKIRNERRASRSTPERR